MKPRVEVKQNKPVDQIWSYNCVDSMLYKHENLLQAKKFWGNEFIKRLILSKQSWYGVYFWRDGDEQPMKGLMRHKRNERIMAGKPVRRPAFPLMCTEWKTAYLWQ